VEVAMEVDKQMCHFLAQVERYSKASSDSVSLKFRNKVWCPQSPYSEQNLSTQKSSVIINDDARNRKFWETHRIRKISPDEHRIENKYNSFLQFKEKIPKEILRDVYHFEKYREELCDFMEGFVNGQCYDKASEVLDYLIEADHIIANYNVSHQMTIIPKETPSSRNTKKRKLIENIEDSKSSKLEKKSNQRDSNEKKIIQSNDEPFILFGQIIS